MKRTSRWTLAVCCLVAGAVGGFFLNERLTLQAQPAAKAIPAVPKELTSYRDIVKTIVPAVVSIEAKTTRRRPKFGDGAGPGQRSSAVLGVGSGVIVDPKGVVLTNFHVVSDADALDIYLPDGRVLTAKEWHGDRKTDLAIVRIEADKPLPYLELGDSDAMEVGDRVLAVGAPFGLASSVTHGIISAKSRNLRINQYEDFLQTDAAINPGNSGGPLVSLDGKVIGINSAIKTRSGGFQGVSLAISSNLCRDIMKQLLANGVVKRGYLGVQVRDIDAELGAKLGLKHYSGVLVTSIFDDSPAAKSGLKVGDVVESIGGKPVRDGVELQKVIAGMPLNQPVEVQMIRNGNAVRMKLVIEEQPDDFGDVTPKGER